MQLTRRGQELLSVAVVVVGVGVLAQTAWWVYLGLGVGALLLGEQVRSFRSFLTTSRELRIECTSSQDLAAIDEDIQIELTVELSTPQTTYIEVEAPLPVAADGPTADRRTVELEPGMTQASTTFPCSFAVAGEHTLPASTVTLHDTGEYFSEMFSQSQETTVIVEPEVPRNVHVGQAGDAVTAYGTHETNRQGSGITPAELRQYVPGDAIRHIDWKATARLNDPHVREYEAETDRQTLVVFDQRATMNLGRDGATMLAYAREVALGLVRIAERNDDPLGLYTVADDVSTALAPGTAPTVYQRARTALLEAHPSTSHGWKSKTAGVQIPSAVERSAMASELAGDSSTFARTLQPFFEKSGTPMQVAKQAPLTETIERLAAETTGDRWIVLFTSAADRKQVTEAIERAQHHGHAVTVFLTPSVLFETDGMADIERAYDRYRSFEEFRQSLSRYPRVEAFEIAPGDRLHAVLEQGRQPR